MSKYIKHMGISNDGRTNKWQIICHVCGKNFQPPTSMLAKHTYDCPNKRCNSIINVDYNKETVEIENKND